MSKPNVFKSETTKSYIWLQTADGYVEQVEQDVALFCPLLRREILAGKESSESHPLLLPTLVNAIVLLIILDYCRFHHLPGRSNWERKSFNEKFIRMDASRLHELLTAADALQITTLVHLTSEALARVIEEGSLEEIRQVFGQSDDLTEEEKWKPIENTTDNTQIRLLNKLYARKMKELKEKEKEKEKVKNVEVEAQHVDDRSIDELVSYINGENRDQKEATTSTNKKNRKRKNKPKKAPSVCTIAGGSSLPINASKESASHGTDKDDC